MPTLFWSAGAGEEGQQIDVVNAALGPSRFIAVPVTATDVLPPGNYDLEPLVWSGEFETWLPNSQIAVLSVVTPAPTDLLEIIGGEVGLNLSAIGTGTVQMIGPGNAVVLQEQASIMSASSVQRLFLAVDGAPVFDANSDGVGGISFLGKTPTVGVQTVSNSDALVALNSLLLALSEFGLINPVSVALPAAVRSIGYTVAAPLVLEVVPAGHTPGNYEIASNVLTRTAATAGTVSRSFQWSAPTFGAVSGTTGGSSISVTGSVPLSTVSVYSDGVSAITMTLTPVGVTGSPVLDVTAQATLIGT